MKLKARAVFSLLLTALMLTSCGTAVESDFPDVLPSMDEIPGEAVSVDINSADASPSAVGAAPEEPGKAIPEEVESILTAPEPEETHIISEKEEFSYTPDYDEEFFANDLFIGDSISTGYSGYGILDEKNIFAKIGLNPLTALDTEVLTANGEVLLSEEIELTRPERAYIMLGSNGIDWLSCSMMAEAIGEVCDRISEISPETKVVVLSIPPVTKEYDLANEELEVMKKINDYNSLLEELCSEKQVDFIDITTMLEDNEGYFVYYYAEKDGMHFKPTAYKMILSKIQYTLS